MRLSITKTRKETILIAKRPPFHVCAWHKKNKEFRFPSVNYGEDWGWVEQFIKYAKTEVHIDKVLHKYNFRGPHSNGSKYGG
jgi:hypothetical protein